MVARWRTWLASLIAFVWRNKHVVQHSAATPRYKLNSSKVHLEEISKALEWKVTFKNSFSFYFNFTINGKWINEKTKEREEIVRDYYHSTKFL